jgi:hypothetical protein
MVKLEGELQLELMNHTMQLMFVKAEPRLKGTSLLNDYAQVIKCTQGLLDKIRACRLCLLSKYMNEILLQIVADDLLIDDNIKEIV